MVPVARLSAQLSGRGADKHFVAFESANSVTAEAASVLEHVVGDVVSIWPYTHLRIVIEVSIKRVGIAEVSASWVAGSRNSNTLSVRCSGNGELSQDPTVSQLIILDDGIAVVIRLAASTEALPHDITLFRKS